MTMMKVPTEGDLFGRIEARIEKAVFARVEKLVEERMKIAYEELVENLQDRIEQLLNAQQVADTNERTAVKDINSKVNAPWRSCEEIRAVDPTATSGNYQIDPDGWTVGDGLISVFCDMTTGN